VQFGLLELSGIARLRILSAPPFFFLADVVQEDEDLDARNGSRATTILEARGIPFQSLVVVAQTGTVRAP